MVNHLVPEARKKQAQVHQDLQAGLEHHRAGRLDRAEQMYRKVLQRTPTHPDALHLLGVVAFSRGQFERSIELIGKALERSPNLGIAHLNLGNALRELRRLEEAAESYRRAIALMPASALAYSNLGRVLNDLRRPDAAVEACRTSIALDATLAAPQVNLAAALTELRRLDEAEVAYLRAVMLEPDRADTYKSLGMLLAELERYDEALTCTDRAIRLKPNDVTFHCARASVLARRKDLETAVAEYRHAIALAPGNIEAWIGLGWALRLLGRFDEADTCLARVRELDPDNLEGVRHLSTTGRSTGDAAEIERLTLVLGRSDLSPRDRIIAGFALGKLLDNADRYDEAFSRYDAANKACQEMNAAAGNRFDIAAFRRRVDLLIDYHTPEYFAERPGINRSELPVFVVGMPRSGTSLVEQILATHSQVFGAGELHDIGRIADAVTGNTGTEVAAREGDWVAAARLAELQLERLRRFGRGAQRVVDKMPDNVLQLGLIAVLFPNARVILCTRDAHDLSLSCYFQQFGDGLQSFSYELADCGRRCLEVERLIAHWQQVLPLRVHEVRYEHLIADLEGETRRLIDFLGLAWEPGCLEFYRTERAVTTMSHWQVRQPLYSRSVGRWRHYERHLGPLLEVLSPGGRLLN
jgi:tetratricopeptide (TPR) repeat protein